MYPTRVVSDQSQVSSEGPWEKLLDNGQDLSATAGPVVNGESSTFFNHLSGNEKFGENYEQPSQEETDETENEYSGIGIPDDKNLTDLIPTADAVSGSAVLVNYLFTVSSLFCVVLPVALRWMSKL